MDIFVQLSLIIVFAALVASVMRVLKQPLIVGHILTGVIVGPMALGFFQNLDAMEALSKFGISILLFIVGMGLSPKVVKDVGKVSVITGIGQIIFTTFFGFLIANLFGYPLVTSMYIAIALTFSSTIIILKLLTDRGDTEKLYGRISIGFLLVQDLVATLILLAVSTYAGSGNASEVMLLVLSKGIGVTLILAFLGIKVLPKLSAFFASSGELLFLFSIGWGLGIAALFQYIGFSLEVGALLAGVALSFTPYSQEMASKLKPLRDFFLIIFFVSLGAGLVVSDIGSLLPQVLLFSLFVLVGNPLIILILMGFLGYKKRTSFMAGLTVAQISEFSLILILLGVQVGHLETKILSLVTLVGLVTIAGSTYMITYADGLYHIIKKYLSFFERKKTKKESDLFIKYDTILFGGNRVGYDFVESFKGLGQKFLCIDYDPKVVKQLVSEGVNCRYGDMEDIEFLEEINVKQAKLIVSTIPDFDANLLLLNVVKRNPEVIVVVISYNIDQALELYREGANYVILPHFIGGRVASEMINDFGLALRSFNKERKKHLNYLKKRKDLGHTHPIHFKGR